MSQQYPPNPLNYSYQIQPPRRPLSVSVIGWIAAILGGLGLFCGVIGLAMQPFLAQMQANNPFYAGMNSSPSFREYNLVSQIFGLGFCIVLLTAGIGSLGLKSWARKLMVGSMIYYMFATLVQSIVSYMFIIPAAAKSMANQPASPFQPQVQTAILGFGMVLGLIIVLVLCGLVIFFYTREHVKAAFEPEPFVPPAPPLPPGMSR